jgi:hypothetical protein
MAEQAFASELGALISHLGERLSGSDDGKPKVFRDTAVVNLKEFFSRFGELNVRSNPELDSLVDQARSLVGDVAPQDLRDNQSLRERIVSQLSVMQSALDGLLVDRPRRRILRTPSRPAAELPAAVAS